MTDLISPSAASRTFCIGRNYAAHAAELQNAVPASPVIFLKPGTSIVPVGQTVPFPRHGGELHFETELTLLIGKAGRPSHENEAPTWIAGLGLGFDLTLRDVQDRLKTQGLPWELAKAFDASALLGDFVPYESSRHDLRALKFEGFINGERRQVGDTALLLFPIARLLVEIGQAWSFLPGDVVFTGTPAGVGKLAPGDELLARGAGLREARWRMARDER